MKYAVGVIIAAALAMLAGCSWFDEPTEPQQAAPKASIDASDGDYGDRVIVVWDSISGAVQYSVLRATHKDSAYTILAQHIDSLRFDDNSVTAGSSYYYIIVGYNSTGSVIDSTSSDKGFASLSEALPAPTGAQASDGTSNTGVTITWNAVTGAAYYKVFRCRSVEGDYVHVGGDAAGTAFTDTSAGPGPYYYTVSAFTATDIEGAHSNGDLGYRKITNTEFFHECDTTVMRSNAKISKLGELGEEIIAGDISGTCHYETEIPSLGRATATLTYSNYKDYYLVLDGSYVSDTDFGGNGDMTGTLTITGIYNGTIEYHLEIKNKDGSGGYYRVCQTDGECEDIQYTSVK